MPDNCIECLRLKTICDDCQEIEFSAHIHQQSFEEMENLISELRGEIQDLKAALNKQEKQERADFFRGDFNSKAFNYFVEKLEKKNPHKKSEIQKLKKESYDKTRELFVKIHGNKFNA